jgi:anti-sigma factor RsiW
LPPPCIDDETLAAYADGSLAVDGRAAVDEHVDRCHACRRLLAAVGASSDGGERVGAPIRGEAVNRK